MGFKIRGYCFVFWIVGIVSLFGYTEIAPLWIKISLFSVLIIGGVVVGFIPHKQSKREK